jgi:uncharacterized protein YbcI
MANPDTNPKTSSVEAAISKELGQIHSDSYGVGASEIYTIVRGDFVFVIMDIELLKAEQVVMDTGRGELVKGMRGQFQEAIESTFSAAVERSTGRRVIAFLSDTHLDPSFSVEMFRLGPPVEEIQGPADPYEG